METFASEKRKKQFKRVKIPSSKPSPSLQLQHDLQQIHSHYTQQQQHKHQQEQKPRQDTSNSPKNVKNVLNNPTQPTSLIHQLVQILNEYGHDQPLSETIHSSTIPPSIIPPQHYISLQSEHRPEHDVLQHYNSTYNEETHLWETIIFPSGNPAYRTDVLILQQWLYYAARGILQLSLPQNSTSAAKFPKPQEEDSETRLESLFNLYDFGMHELARQEYTTSPERSRLLLSMWESARQVFRTRETQLLRNMNQLNTYTLHKIKQVDLQNQDIINLLIQKANHQHSQASRKQQQYAFEIELLKQEIQEKNQQLEELGAAQANYESQLAVERTRRKRESVKFSYDPVAAFKKKRQIEHDEEISSMALQSIKTLSYQIESLLFQMAESFVELNISGQVTKESIARENQKKKMKNIIEMFASVRNHDHSKTKLSFKEEEVLLDLSTKSLPIITDAFQLVVQHSQSTDRPNSSKKHKTQGRY